MRIRLRRPREVALALRELARRRPAEAEQYLDAHQAEWGSLAEADPANAADILEAIGDDVAAALIAELDPEEAADVLEEMRPGAAADVVEEIGSAAAAPLLEGMAAADLADLVGELDEEEARQQLLAELSPAKRERVERLLAYAPDSAGGLMRLDVAALPIGLTAGEAIEALRRLHDTLEELSYVYVIDDEQRLRGVLSFRELVFARPGTGIDEVMVPDPVAVRPDTDREDVAELIQRYNLFSLPVVDHRQVLIGIVTVEDVIEAVQEEASEDIAAMVGAGITETAYSPVLRSVRNRLPWIMVNLGIAFMVAGVISQFEETIASVAVLAAYMPVVALVGGNSGAQSLAVLIRELAIEDIPLRVARQVILRQVAVGLVNGVVVAIAAGLLAAFLTESSEIGFVVGVAMLATMVIAGLAGAGIPVLLQKLGLDPALASNIFLTMVTDIVGFGGFLTVATLVL